MENLLSYADFLEICERALKTNEFQSKDYTTCGGTKILYEAQKGLVTIEYTEEALWRFHFNAEDFKELVGEGISLNEAVEDYKEKMIVDFLFS